MSQARFSKILEASGLGLFVCFSWLVRRCFCLPYALETVFEHKITSKSLHCVVEHPLHEATGRFALSTVTLVLCIVSNFQGKYPLVVEGLVSGSRQYWPFISSAIMVGHGTVPWPTDRFETAWFVDPCDASTVPR